MRYLVNTRSRPCSIQVDITANKQTTIWIVVCDAKIANCVYLRKFEDFQPNETKKNSIGLPICGDHVIVEVFENVVIGKSGIEKVNVQRKSLNKRLNVIDMKNEMIRNSIDFILRFSLNAGWMEAGKDKFYVSDHSSLKINYLPAITDNDYTPARIDRYTNIIEASQAKMVPATVPMRAFWLFHELAHKYINKDEAYELEADINGLIIGLGIGFPRSEAIETYSTAFEPVLVDSGARNGSEVYSRYEHIQNFIKEFDSIVFDHI